MKSTLTGNKNLDIEILNQLDDEDLVSFCKTSKYADQLCNDQILWQRRLISKFGNIISLDIMKEYKGDRSWSDYYIELQQSIRNKNQSELDTLLYSSSMGGKLDLVILSLDWGANIHYNNEYSLIFASLRGHLDVVKYLVEKGANINAQNNLAFRWASKNGHLDVVKSLAKKGANIHTYNDLALRLASRYGKLNIVKYLVKNGGNIHAKDDRALSNASLHGHLNVVKYLVENGANITIQEVELVREHNQDEIVNYLEEQMI